MICCALLLITYMDITDGWEQGVTRRCRLSRLTNSVLVYEPKCGGGGGGVAGSQPMSTAVHIERK